MRFVVVMVVVRHGRKVRLSGGGDKGGHVPSEGWGAGG
jgi:hypothetical protein